jgi:hypothetical protein
MEFKQHFQEKLIVRKWAHCPEHARPSVYNYLKHFSLICYFTYYYIIIRVKYAQDM